MQHNHITDHPQFGDAYLYAVRLASEQLPSTDVSAAVFYDPRTDRIHAVNARDGACGEQAGRQLILSTKRISERRVRIYSQGDVSDVRPTAPIIERRVA